MLDALSYLQLIYSIVAFLCGGIILSRNIRYKGNIMFGIGYIIYGVPGILLFISHIYLDNVWIYISVRMMIICSMLGIVFLYFGARIFYEGTKHLNWKSIHSLLLITIILIIITQSIPNAIVIISYTPLNSKLHPITGISLFLWHIFICSLALRKLYQMRRSLIETDEKEITHKINLILTGFYLSILALMLYSIGNFGESRIGDYLLFVFALLDLLFIWRGLIK